MSQKAIDLSAAVIKNVERADTSLSELVGKAKRLAQLVEEPNYEAIMQYEVEGYPTPRNGIAPEIRAMAAIAGRVYERPDPMTNEPKQYVYVQSIGELEATLQEAEADLAALRAGSAGYSPNPYRSMYIHQAIDRISGRLMGRRSFLYRYALLHHYRLRAEQVSDEEAQPLCAQVDQSLKTALPQRTASLVDEYKKAGSQDADDLWHVIVVCRRVLHELADLESTLPGKESPDGAASAMLQRMGGVSRILTFLHVFQGDQGASSQEEAQRYVVGTTLLMGDLLALW